MECVLTSTCDAVVAIELRGLSWCTSHAELSLVANRSSDTPSSTTLIPHVVDTVISIRGREVIAPYLS